MNHLLEVRQASGASAAADQRRIYVLNAADRRSSLAKRALHTAMELS